MLKADTHLSIGSRLWASHLPGPFSHPPASCVCPGCSEQRLWAVWGNGVSWPALSEFIAVQDTSPWLSPAALGITARAAGSENKSQGKEKKKKFKPGWGSCLAFTITHALKAFIQLLWQVSLSCTEFLWVLQFRCLFIPNADNPQLLETVVSKLSHRIHGC